jgi:oligopeptide transport system substrate-binding protein
MRARLSMTFGVALVLLFAAACGGGGDAREDGTTADVLRVNYGSEPPSLDPALVTDVTSANVVNALADPLIKLGDDLEPMPNLAERWAVSADGKTVTFHLREDGRWTNGDPVTARDFEWSWKRVLDPETAADYAYQFYGIAGAHEYNACKKDCAKLRERVGVRAVDDRTLEVRLTSPQPWFVAQTAHTSFLAVHRATVERHGEKWTEPETIVTNGPFRLTKWEHEDSLTLERWAEWRDADSVAVARIEGRMIGDATTALGAFEAGEIDACIDRPTCIPLAELDRIKTSRDYANHPALETHFVGVNVENVPDVNQRRALAFAVDRRSIVENITKADETPATSFTPEGMPGFDVIRQDFLPTDADVERARAYLGRARAAKRSLTLVTSNDAPSRQLSQALQGMWDDLGLRVTIKAMEWAQFLEFIGPPPNRSVDLFLISWIGDYVDDMNFLDLWTCEGGLNSTKFCDAEYDRLIEQARRTPDDGARHRLYAELEHRLTGAQGALPVIPLFWGTQPILRKAEVKGWKPNLLGQFDYTKVRIEPAE